MKHIKNGIEYEDYAPLNDSEFLDLMIMAYPHANPSAVDVINRLKNIGEYEFIADLLGRVIFVTDGSVY